MNHTKVNTRAGLLYALVAAIGLGAVTTQAKFVYDYGGNAMTLMLWRFVCSVVVIAAIIIIKRGTFTVQRAILPAVVWLGVIWCGAMICYLLSVQTITVSLAVLILYSYPLLVMVASLLCGHLAMSVKVVAVFIAGFCGIAMMLWSNQLTFDPLGVAFAAMAAAGAAFTFMKGGEVAPKINPLVLSLWVNSVGVVLIMPLIYKNFHMPSSVLGLACLASATLCYIIAIIAQFAALSHLTAARAALLFNIEPVFSILLAMIVLGETLTPLQSSGALLVIAVLCGFMWSQNKIMHKSMPKNMSLNRNGAD